MVGNKVVAFIMFAISISQLKGLPFTVDYNSIKVSFITQICNDEIANPASERKHQSPELRGQSRFSES